MPSFANRFGKFLRDMGDPAKREVSRNTHQRLKCFRCDFGHAIKIETFKLAPSNRYVGPQVDGGDIR